LKIQKVIRYHTPSLSNFVYTRNSLNSLHKFTFCMSKSFLLYYFQGMAYKYSFNKKLQIASIEQQTSWHRFKALTLMQNTRQKQPSINAYLGARYSRSADSVMDIAKEITQKGINASERLEMIFQGYGHKSVGDMAQLFVCLENLPIFEINKLFYVNPVISGQERSTRFQNFKNPNFINLPRKIGEYYVPSEVRNSYEKVVRFWMESYRDLLEPTRESLTQYFKPEKDNKQHESAMQARTFDMARSFLPIGIESSSAFVMSARSWAELISYLKGSNQIIENEVAKLICTLLTGNSELEKLGYIPEADSLICHTEPNTTREDSTREILALLKKVDVSSIKRISESSSISFSNDTVDSLIKHYILLLNPLADLKKIKISRELVGKIGGILSKNHNHHNQIGNIAQTGSILIEGYGDYGGIVKDINRHRSLERFFPLFHNQLDINKELDRDEIDCFVLYEYLKFPEMNLLRKDYEKRLVEGYKLVKSWIKLAKKKLKGFNTEEKENLIREYARYLLPHSHCTKYRLYGSVDDWQYVLSLRTRNGGHIQYRKAAGDWLSKLRSATPLFDGYFKKIPNVDPKSREQFFDRS